MKEGNQTSTESDQSTQPVNILQELHDALREIYIEAGCDPADWPVESDETLITGNESGQITHLN